MSLNGLRLTRSNQVGQVFVSLLKMIYYSALAYSLKNTRTFRLQMNTRLVSWSGGEHLTPRLNKKRM